MTCQGCGAPLHGMPLTGHVLTDKKHSSELRIVVTTTCLRLTFIITYQSFYIFYLGVTSLTNVQMFFVDRDDIIEQMIKK